MHPKRNRKFLKRLSLVLASSLQQLLVPLFHILIAFCVIRFSSAALWGEFVFILIVLQAGMYIASWGNKEYLLKEFSLKPAQLGAIWQKSSITRLLLYGALLFIGLPLSKLSPAASLFLILWSFGLYVQQSFEAVTIFRKQFAFALTIETFGILLVLGAILILRDLLTLDHLLLIFAIATLCKAICFLIRYFHDIFRRFTAEFDFHFIRAAFPFFVLGLAGMLQAKVDLFLINYFLGKKDVGEYQVFLSLLIYLKNGAYFLVAPFARSLYRLDKQARRKISMQLLWIGSILLVPGISIAFFLITEYYRFEYAFYLFVIGYFFALPYYLYIIKIYELLKSDNQSLVSLIVILGTGLNVVLNILLIPSIGVTGALLSGTAAQWLILLLYHADRYFFAWMNFAKKAFFTNISPRAFPAGE
jgi:O-antigen/teichoic acid export membrane protein